MSLSTLANENSDKPGEHEYYMVIDIPSVKEIFSYGWPIYIGKEMRNRMETNNIYLENGELSVNKSFEVAKEIMDFDRKVAISVVGLFNRGKTYLLNLLADMNFETGKKYSTKGLSFAVPKDAKVAEGIYIIDTEGSNVPLSKEAIDKVKDIVEKEHPFEYKTEIPENIEDIEEATKLETLRKQEYANYYSTIREKAIVEKIATEGLLQEMIVRLADVLIVVVNEMTWDDQQYIESLIKYQKQQNYSFRIIVIHNYKETSSYDDFISLREKYVTSCAVGEFIEKPLGDGSTVEIFQSFDESQIAHGFLVKHDSDIGKTMNHGTIQWLKQIFNIAQKKNTQKFLSKLISTSKESLGNLVNDPGKIKLHYNEDCFRLVSKSENHNLINNVLHANTRGVIAQCSSFKPIIDCMETEKDYIITLDLPGYQPDASNRIGSLGMSINNVNNQLTITGERKLYYVDRNNEVKEYDDTLISNQRNRKAKDFVKVIQLPKYVRCENIAKAWSQGQLSISFPKITEEPTFTQL